MDPENCQIHCLSEMAERGVPVPVYGPFGRLKLFFKRRLSPQTKRAIKKRLAQLYGAVPRHHEAVDDAPPVLGLKAGEWVRVRPFEEIRATLDAFGALRGCVFMPEMKPYCGTVQRVLKPVNVFLDERDYRLKKVKHTVLLEGVICEGTATYGRCDRSCFFFWRENWLERLDVPPAE